METYAKMWENMGKLWENGGNYDKVVMDRRSKLGNTQREYISD